jgi:hypothetical protein
LATFLAGSSIVSLLDLNKKLPAENQAGSFLLWIHLTITM